MSSHKNDKLFFQSSRKCQNQFCRNRKPKHTDIGPNQLGYLLCLHHSSPIDRSERPCIHWDMFQFLTYNPPKSSNSSLCNIVKWIVFRKCSHRRSRSSNLLLDPGQRQMVLQCLIQKFEVLIWSPYSAKMPSVPFAINDLQLWMWCWAIFQICMKLRTETPALKARWYRLQRPHSVKNKELD